MKKPVGRQIDTIGVAQNSPRARRQQGDIRSTAEKDETRRKFRARSDKKVVWIDLLNFERSSSGGTLPRWLRELAYGKYKDPDNVVVLNSFYPSTADIITRQYKINLLGMWRDAECRLKLKKTVKDILIYGLVRNDPPNLAGEFLEGQMFYKDRENKAVDAPNFLNSIYRNELVAGTLTLSDLRKRDESLWRALRNWAHNGKHELDELIPRGQTERGRPREKLGFDPTALNPDDPIHALALQAVDIRARGRERASRSYSARKLQG